MTDKGGHFNQEENDILTNELHGESEITTALDNLKQQKNIIAKKLQEKYPGKNYFQGKIEDRSGNSSVTKVEIKIKPDGQTDLLVSIGDLNQAANLFEANLVATIHEQTRQSYMNVSIRQESEDGTKKERGISLNSGKHRYTHTSTGSGITSNELLTATNRILRVLTKLEEKPEMFDQFIAQKELPPMYQLGGPKAIHPEAKWN